MSKLIYNRCTCKLICKTAPASVNAWELRFYWIAVGEPGHKMQTELSPTSTTKVRNSYPEEIACVLCFPRVFQATEEYFLDRSQDYLWKLQVDLTRK